MIDFRKLKVGMVVRIKSEDHWDIEDGTCDDVDFSSGLDQEMRKNFGEVGTIVANNDLAELSEVSIYDNVDIKFQNDTYAFAWDLHSISEILNKENYPEYYLWLGKYL